MAFLVTLRVIAAACLATAAAFAQAGAAELKSFNRALSELTDGLSSSVVQVSTNGFLANPASSPAQLRFQQGKAAGVIVATDGYILTNAHVVFGASRILVQVPVPGRGGQGSILRPRSKSLPAEVAGIDRETDLALLKVAEKGLRPLEFADSDTVRQGQLALAMGSPLGLDNSVSLGVVSAVARQLRPEDPVIYIQTDATINPGNSGGPLVDVDGKVIGINTMILSQSGGSEGVGFAIPSNIVRNVYEQLRKSGKVTRGEIGIEAQTITPGLATTLQLPRDQGVILADVIPGRPADIAGLQAGDIVLRLDRKPMENARQLMVNLYAKPINGIAELEVIRGSDTLTKRVVILEREDDPGRFASLVRRESNLVPKLGILGLALDQDVSSKFPGLRRPYGILVAALVRENSALEPGDVIYSLNGKALSNLTELRALLDGMTAGDGIVLYVERNGRLRYVELPIE
jgi:serine protease Do